MVDVLVTRGRDRSRQFLMLRRAPGGRNPGSWEAVHGGIEPGETPHQAAVRELREETGLEAVAWFNLSRVESFYRHSVDTVVMIPVFVAEVAADAEPRCSDEHDQLEWLDADAAAARASWPRMRRQMADVGQLLSADSLEKLADVLRM